MDAVSHFDRWMRLRGVTAWAAGRMDDMRLFGTAQPVVLLLSSPEMAAWNAHYAEERYARHDPLVAYGRGPNRAATVDSLPMPTAMARRIADERRRQGFANGMIVPTHPINPGGFVTLWNVSEDVLAEPGGVAWQEVVGLCFYVVERGDFSYAVRLHARGERLSDGEAAVVRPLLSGRSTREVAAMLGIKPRSVGTSLDRARRRLIGLGLIPEWAGRDAVVVAADQLGLLP